MPRNTVPTNEEEPLLKWPGLEDIFGWSEEKLEEEQQQILKAPRYYEQLLSYIRRPAEATKGGIEAAIEKEPVLPALKGGLLGEEETKGRDILTALGIPIDDPEWILDHPVQHFLWEMGGGTIDFFVDPVLWGLWFTPSTKVLKGAQRYLARKEITQFTKLLKKDLAGLPGPGAERVFLEQLKTSPRYSKYITKPWFREITQHFRGTEYGKFLVPWKKARKFAKEPVWLTKPAVTGPDFIPFFTTPAKMTPQSLELLPKFAPLAAKAGGIIPNLGTSEYIRYWDALSPSNQKLELERKKLLKAPRETLFAEAEMPRTKQMAMYKQELETLHKAGMTGKAAEKEAMTRAGDKFRKLQEKKPVSEQLKWELGRPTIKGQIEFPAPEVAPKAEVPYPTAKEVVEELSTKLKTKQNEAIEEAVLTTGIPPDSLKQGVYVYNHTGESITEPDKLSRAFEKLLEKNNPVAFKAISTGTPQVTIEEVSVKMATLDKEIARLNKESDTEFASVRDFLYEQTLPEIETLYDRVKAHGGIKYTPAMKDYPEEWKQMSPSLKSKTGLPIDEMADELNMDIEDLVAQLARYKAKPKASEFDNQAYELIEGNLGDFPNYMKRMELLDQRDRYQSALLELRTKQPAPSPETVIDQREVKIEPSPKLEEDKITPLIEKPEEEKAIADAMNAEMENIRAIEQMKLRFGDVISDKGPTPPRDLGWELDPPIKGRQLFLNVIPPEDLPVDIEPWPTTNKDVGALASWRREDFMFSDYERATGIPIASQGSYAIRDASVEKRREEIILGGTLSHILSAFPKDRRIAIGKAMEGKKVELSEAETVALKGMQNFYEFLGKKFGAEMIENYLPRIMKFMRTGDPGVLPKKMQAWFKKHRIGDLKPRMEDPLEITRIYIHAGLRDKYLYESRLIPDFVKHIQNQPFGIKKTAEFWLTHKILGHPTRFDKLIATTMDNMGLGKIIEKKWGVDSSTALRQITRVISQVMYTSGIGGRIVSVGKNVTQEIHNMAILGPKYFIKGLMNAPRKEEREVVEALNILRRYGAELERRGVDNPASIPQKVVDAGNYLFRTVGDSFSRRVCLAGTRAMVSDNYKLLHQGKIDKQEFLKRTKFDLVPFGRRPEAIQLFNDGDIEGYANVLGKEFVNLGQFSYEPEDMPLIFSGSMGRLASVFMSWPIEYIEMQAHFVKTGHWESILYYYLAAMAVQNGLRYAGIETNPYGYGDVQIGNHRISLIPGGWFLSGSMPTGFSPAIQILLTGGKVVGVHTKGASDRFLAETREEFKRAAKILIPFGLAGADIIQVIEEIESGTYGKRDKNGRLMYVSDESEVILRGLGFATPAESEKRYREPIYEFGQEERKRGKPSPIRREAPSWWELH